MEYRKILVFATKGSDSNEEARILQLLQSFSVQILPFNRTNRVKSFINIIKEAFKTKPQLIVMEGTGSLGGIACLFIRFFFGIPYIFSSGDAITPFINLKYPLLAPIVNIYEQMLCRFCAGFIGWTPYLVGRALTYGAPKGITAAGWEHFSRSLQQLNESRVTVRQKLGIAEDSLVFGILGSIAWMPRFGYCYGYELVKAFQKINRKNLSILVVGDGTGLSYLKEFSR